MKLPVKPLLHIGPEFAKYVACHLQAQAQASVFKDAKRVALIGRIPCGGDGPGAVHIGEAGKSDGAISIDTAGDYCTHDGVTETATERSIGHAEVAGIFFMKRRYSHFDPFANDELAVLRTEAFGDAFSGAAPLIREIAGGIECGAGDGLENGLRAENPAAPYRGLCRG